MSAKLSDFGYYDLKPFRILVHGCKQLDASIRRRGERGDDHPTIRGMALSEIEKRCRKNNYAHNKYRGTFFEKPLQGNPKVILFGWKEIFIPCKSTLFSLNFVLANRVTQASTGRLDRPLHRKWRETKQQPGRARSGHAVA